MTPQEKLKAIRKKLEVSNTELAEIFGYKNAASFKGGTSSPELIKQIGEFYDFFITELDKNVPIVWFEIAHSHKDGKFNRKGFTQFAKKIIEHLKIEDGKERS